MTSRLMKSLAAFLLMMGVMVLPAHADTLQSFINTPTTITSAPLSFTGVTGSLSVTHSTGVSFDPTVVSVTTLTNLDGPGLEFSGAFGSAVGSGKSLEVAFKYSATASAGTLIHDVSMTILSAAATGTGSVTITESVYSDAAMTQQLAKPYTYVYDPSQTSKFYDMLLTTPETTVYVKKDITIAGGTSGTASISDFSQNYSLVPVPEPATVALACGGLPVLGLFWARRRRAI